MLRIILLEKITLIPSVVRDILHLKNSYTKKTYLSDCST